MLLAGLTRAEQERTRTRAEDGSAEPRDLTGPPPWEVGPALIALAEHSLASGSAPVYAPAAEVVLHRAGTVTRASDGPALGQAEAEEATCSATVREVVTGDGCVLAWGRARRRPSPAQLRALHLRDGGCCTPGCGRTRFLHAHHVTAWSAGGRTDLDNLLLLCGGCHRSLHQGDFSVTATGGQRFRFQRNGVPWLPAPPTSGAAADLPGEDLDPAGLTPAWAGEPLDLSYATDVLLTTWKRRSRAA